MRDPNTGNIFQVKTRAPGQELPLDWIDPDTGHRVVRLSTDDNSESSYFHYNWYSADGTKLCFTTPTGISEVDLKTRKVEQLVYGRIIETGRATNEVFYTPEKPVRDSDGRLSFMRPGTTIPVGNDPASTPFRVPPPATTIDAMNLDTRAVRKVVDLPAGHRVTCINADQSLFAGTIIGPSVVDPSGQVQPPPPHAPIDQRLRMFPNKAALTPAEQLAVDKENGLSRRLANPSPMALFTVNAATGEIKTFGYAYASLNHLQFSPVDPTLLMFAHEGTWHEVDRIWTIRTDGSGLKLMHQRMMDMEIVGHEFWGHDGKTIWCDLQTPRSQVFWIGGINIESGLEVHYQVQRDWWSVHYNVSRDGTLFAGDGGDPGQVAFAKDGQWLNLFRRQHDGTLTREKLVNMSKHNYDLEPNVNFTPDGKWVVFRSNMFGPEQIYAVEVAKEGV
jgi:oligogalacturonide lyase